MKILCSISGIQFTCEHFPGTYESREAFHPVFSLPQKALLSTTKKWGAGELTPIDSYLLFLALLKSSDLVDFRVPVIRTEHTDMIVAQNMEKMLRTVIKLNTVTDPRTVFPSCAITHYCRDLSNVDDWLANWDQAYHAFKEGYISPIDSNKLLIRENALARMIKNPHKHVTAYANTIADWAAVAGEFPEFLLTNPLTNHTSTCADYWKQIIQYCTKNEYLFKIPQKDLAELIQHCEEVIPIGSIYSTTLFKVLRGADEKKRNFLGLGDIDLSTTIYKIVPAGSEEELEQAQITAMIDSAPEEEPRPEQYQGKMAYLRAKMRWEMAKKFKGN